MHKVKVTYMCVPKQHEELMLSIEIAGKREEKEKPFACAKEMIELFDPQQPQIRTIVTAKVKKSMETNLLMFDSNFRGSSNEHAPKTSQALGKQMKLISS